ncbi:MAG TPA: hypothetical protein VFA68_03295 [Terriglobales bacterium]|nr:hypothetical protein [Terriglobales bacterium]
MSIAVCRGAFSIGLIALCCSLPGLAAQDAKPSATEIVRRTIENECARGDHASYMFRDFKQTIKGSQTKLIVETRDATAGMLVEVDGKPLTPEQKKAENDRLNYLIHDPEALQKKRKEEKEDEDRTLRIMKALPDAFIYEADGTEEGSADIGREGHQLLRLKFRPNPRYSPPSHTEQVLTGMQGYLLVDEQEHRIAKIDGTLFKDVGFGWGILGHLDKGGKFLVQQADVGNRHWEVTRMNLDFTGKILLFKSLKIKSTEIFSDFRPAPVNLSFKEGVELLRKQHEEMANNHAAKQPAKSADVQPTLH